MAAKKKGDATSEDVAGTLETTEAEPVEGEILDGPIPPDGTETALAAAPEEPAQADPEQPSGELDTDEQPVTQDEVLRDLTHDEEVKAAKAFALFRRQSGQDLDEETIRDVKQEIARDLILRPARVDRFIKELSAKLPPAKIVGYRVHAHGELHRNGQVHKPGDVVKLSAEEAEPLGSVVEPVLEE